MTNTVLSNKLLNYSEVIEQLKEKLSDYLIQKGIINSNTDKFSCIYPDHNDSDPSCGLVPDTDYTIGHCFSCDRNFDIFTAANIMDGLPTSGPKYLSVTIPTLAKQFDVELEYAEMTEEEKEKRRILKLYKIISDYIVNDLSNNNIVMSILAQRGWTRYMTEKMGIGAISSRTKFLSAMHDQGYSTEDIENAGIISKESRINEIFQNDSIIFTLNDAKNQPIGFAARKVNGSDIGVSKYINTGNTNSFGDIFIKRKYLYGLNLLEDLTSDVYIVEGYADVVTLKRFGIKNVVAVCGVSFNEDQLQELTKLGYRNLIIALDNDIAGINATKKIVSFLKFHSDIHVSVLKWNIKEQTDPDKFIKDNGIKKFISLRKDSLLSYLLDTESEKTQDTVELINSIIPIVLNEPSFIRREQMVMDISSYTGLAISTIESEIARKENAKMAKMNNRIQEITYKAFKKTQYNTENTESILSNAVENIQRIQNAFGVNTLTSNSIIDRILDWNKKVIEFGGGNTLNWGRFEGINRVLDTDITDGYMLGIGGHPNTGKSAIMISLMIELLKNNENLSIVFATVDDSFERVLPRLISAVADDAYNLTTIRNIRDIKRIDNKRLKSHIEKIRENALNQILSFVREERLIIFDRSNGVTLPYLQSITTKYRRKHPENKFIVFLDNFHKLNPISYGGGEDKLRIGYRKMSSDLKSLSEKLHIGVVMSIEYNKVDSTVEPKNNDIGETGKILYDCTGIFHLINELDALKENASLYHYDINPIDPFSEVNISKLPTIRIRVGKSKDNFFKGNLFYDFYPSRGDFREITWQEAQERTRINSSGIIPKEIETRRKQFLAKKKKIID